MERMRGGDAVFMHLERPGTPLHTLKVVVLDHARRGRPVTLDELRRAVEPRLGLVERATQRVVALRGVGRPFWINDPDFDLHRHLDHRVLSAPGDRRELDRLLSELATTHLDLQRPLWGLTLVDGLQGDRQAIVVQVHHAVMDGVAALNTLLACTTEDPEGAIEAVEPPTPDLVDRRRMRAEALAEIPRWAAGMGGLVRDGWVSHRRAKAFRTGAPAAPPFIGAHRNFCNTPSGPERVCASGTLPFEPFQRVAKSTDSTINGVLHAVIAGAMRRQLERRHGDLSRPTVAVFGIAADPTSDRRWGNNITPTTVRMHSELADPMERLRQTADSCRQGVELRRKTGLDMASRWTEATCRLGPAFQRNLAYRWPKTVNHVTTANVAGPRRNRWIGDLEVVDWISFAVTVPPSNLNVTVYSYAGSMCIGIVTTPEVMDDPHQMLDDMEAALDELTALVPRGSASGQSPAPATGASPAPTGA